MGNDVEAGLIGSRVSKNNGGSPHEETEMVFVNEF